MQGIKILPIFTYQLKANKMTKQITLQYLKLQIKILEIKKNKAGADLPYLTGRIDSYKAIAMEIFNQYI